jgi:hypothetical protein
MNLYMFNLLRSYTDNFVCLFLYTVRYKPIKIGQYSYYQYAGWPKLFEVSDLCVCVCVCVCMCVCVCYGIQTAFWGQSVS